MPNELATLAKELGIAELPQEAQEQLVAGFGEVALKAATVAVLEKLTEEAREKFAILIEAGDGAAVQAFLDKELPGHEAIAGDAIRAEFTNFKEAVVAPV